jgi:uncharacterized YigZ family protein
MAQITYTLKEAVHGELWIKKSQFITCVQPVTGRPEAVALVNDLWALHPEATHICWALMAGGESAAVDDGEPGGTAGRPMMEVLRHQGLEGVLATVVRYFGGIKLGAGGLVRAYNGAVAQALIGAEKVPLVRRKTLQCRVPYSMEGLLRREIQTGGHVLQGIVHGDDVEMSISVPEERAGDFARHIDDLSQGQARWGKSDDETAAAP